MRNGNQLIEALYGEAGMIPLLGYEIILIARFRRGSHDRRGPISSLRYINMFQSKIVKYPFFKWVNN